MAGYDDTYSRVVSWAKVLLPVMALMLLSVMFLIARSIDPNSAIPIAEVDVEGIAREQGVSRPNFSGVTEDGSAITFTADAVRPVPDTASDYIATDLAARVETPDGAVVRIESAQARMLGEQNVLTLSGGVKLTTSTNYVIQGEGLSARLDSTWIESTGAVTADGPAGHVSAGQVTLTREDGEGAPYLLVFKGGVKLVYTPQSGTEEK